MKRSAWISLFVAIMGGASGCGSVDEKPPDAAIDSAPSVDAPPAPDGSDTPDGPPPVDGAGECILGTGVLGVCRL